MHSNSREKLEVETLWPNHCRYCKKDELCRFHKILKDYSIDPMKVNVIDIRKFGQTKKFSIRLIYMSKSTELIELTLSFPSMHITVIGGSGKDRKSLITLKFSEKLITELFLISSTSDIQKLKKVDDPTLRKIYRNIVGD